MVIMNFLIAPFAFLVLWFRAKTYKGDYMPGFKITKFMAKRAIWGGNIKLEVHGLENIPEKDGFIFYPNHQGLFDSLTFYASCPKPFACVIKKEAKNIILLKQVNEATGTLAMDREDVRQSMRVIQQISEEVKEGRNYLIFAEGHRSREGNKVQEFKAGSFKAAQKAQCPIVPCALINCFIPFDVQSIRRVTVKLIYLKPMYYEEYKDMKTVEIAAEVKRRIVETIAQYE
ncbi:MAG: 1-acyl-sn-glycerol-3-phosphate acyltransferase [Lachnospiraceae bacterium]|nr:1-acyl-sn-glycerol-3-phosphate acyltransferase [Lachnospiraceae bacterium]MBQ6094763.1 1-acyl-sn-glycerol-3-phosphate acyltransferase [Lachnospiraceae bacterium]MBR3470329.1 1-acyl-sn-glycerol-3-phosphate acyltransferase [Lachnospiraceae bacterium]MCR5498762.1 1-acyl-sn-glycerol-3-phosphate acyltransferase [Acetatifactor sp.]